MKKLLIALALWALICPQLAFAQGPIRICYTTDRVNCVPGVQASNSVKIDVNAGTTTQLVALSGTKTIYVSSVLVVATTAGTIKFVYGTGSSCGTGTTDLTGVMSLPTTGILTFGDGLGVLLVVPPGNALCITTSAVQMSGSVSYAQF